MRPPDMEGPPALGAEGRAIAVGASAEPIYTIRAIRAIIQATVSPLIDVLNLIDGDPDVEPNGDELDGGYEDDEPSGDELDQSYPDAAGPRGHVIAGRASGHEDDEPDDEDFGGDEAEPDFTGANRPHAGGGPGCSISDPGGCEHDGRELEDGL